MSIGRLISGLSSRNACILLLSSIVSFFVLANFAEAANEFKVQRNVSTIAAGSTTLTLNAPADFIAPASLNNAFVRITNSHNTGAGSANNQVARQVCANIRFNGTAQIIIQRANNTNATRVCWEIVEYIGAPGGPNEFIARNQGLSTFAAAGLNKTEPVTGAGSLPKLAAFVTGVNDNRNSRANYASNLVTASFPDISTVRFDRGVQNNNAIVVSYAVVEFTGANWTVQRIQHQYTAAGAVEIEPLASNVGPLNAFVHVQKRNGGAIHGLDEYGHQVWVSAANQLSFQLQTGATSPNLQYSVAWVIYNPYMKVLRGSGTLTSTGTSPFTGTLNFSPAVSDISNSSLFWNNDCNGTGTQFVRPMVAVRLTGTNSIEYWRYDGTNAVGNAYRYEVVQWPQTAEPFTVSGTVYTDDAKTIPVPAGTPVSVSVNGNLLPYTPLTDASGQYSLTTTAVASDVIAAYIPALSTAKGSAITVTDGASPLSGLDLITGKVVLEHRAGASISNAQLDLVDAVDANDDDGVTIAAGNATFASGFELFIPSGMTYAPGVSAAVNAGGGMKNLGTIGMGGGNLSVTGPTVNSGSINGSVAGGTFTFTGDLSSSGWLNTIATTSLSVTGNFTLSGGDFILNGTPMIVGGNWTRTGGNFNPGTATVSFDNAGQTSTISGDNEFNHLSITTPGKNIVVTAGSTQTVNGKLRIDGSAFGTRVSLSSSGGAGTTWNLVLNGTHDCRYIAVQGSTVFGSAFLPVNPVAFKDNGGNTNWFDPELPGEILFLDNFETSTISSAPPDKTSSNWSIGGAGAGWLTEASVVVASQNHTAGGSQSMYSSGGSSGDGVGAWNFPGWGPQTDCTAEAWFYDDMQAGKMQWIFIDNADGDEGVGVLVETNLGQGLTKYRYCRYNFGGGTLYADSFIDRTLGWHKVTWTHTSGTVELYLDGALLMTASGLSDFSDFDTGSWTWHNTTGSTPMWFDDFIVYRSQAQTRYRWFENDSAQTPTALAAENTAAANRNILATTRLRVQIQNSQYETWDSANVTVQYRKGANGSWEMLGPSADWNWADGLGADKAQVANALLTNTNIRQHFVESRPSQPTLPMTTGQYGEWDFAITSTSNATLSTAYYFRLVVTDPSGAYQRAMAAYPYYPQITLVSPTMTQWTGANSTLWNDAGNWTNGVPDATKDAIMPSGVLPNEPSLNGSGTCKSLVIQNGRTFTMGTAGTDLTVSQDITVYGNLIQSNATATLNLSAGNLIVDTTGRYNQSAGPLNAGTATIRPINGGQWNVSGSSVITADTLNIAVGGLVNVTGAATFNLASYTIDLNGQWTSSNTGNTVNISGNFTNNGSMLGSTGAVFNLNNASGTMSGSSTTTTFYQLNINGGISSSITNDVKVLDDFVIVATKSFTASSGNILVGGDWTNYGTFAHGSGTVTLNGTALQTVTAGGSNFHSLVSTNASVAGVFFADGFSTAYLTNTTANSLMIFAAGQAYNVTASGGLNLQGAASNLVKLRSSATGTKWIINPSGGSWTCDYLDVQDSVNIYSVTIEPTNSTDSGNTINWFSADGDTDGLPDYWEYGYYGDLDETASSDTDSDGLTAILEYEYSTDPTSNLAPNRVYVDDDSSYAGMDGSEANPYKYLEDALNAAPAGSMIILKEGSYRLSNYVLSKNLIISGESPDKTFISGPYPASSSSNTGQCLDVTAAKFAISNITFQDFREEQPVISYSVANAGGLVYMENLKFTGNSTGAKSLIAPTAGVQSDTEVYLLNSLFYGNTCAYVAEIKGNPGYTYHNTIADNTSGGILLSGSGDTKIYNSIVRENSGTEISNGSSGTVSVYNSNVEGGFPGAVASYDLAENYIDKANGVYRPASGTNAINAGVQTFLYADMMKSSRPLGAAVDVGAFEFDPNDDDGDGLSNGDETLNGTNQNNPDSDADGLSDYEELNTYGSNPNLADTDGDGVEDGDEPAIGMDPSDYDGVLWVDMYDEGFENPARYPQNQHVSNSVWGLDATYAGQIFTETGDSYNAGDSVYINFRGGKPESRIIMFVTRNLLPEHWIAIAYKAPWAKLPTNVNQALVISGAHFAVNESGYLCAYDPIRKDWIVHTGTQIPDLGWFRVLVHRNHAGKICNVYLDMTNDGIENGSLVFPNLPIYGPDLDLFIRISFSSVGEYDLKIDNMKGYPWDPRP